MDNYAPDPALQGAFEAILGKVAEYPDKGFLKHILRFRKVPCISAANRQHFAGEALKKHLLAFCVPYYASFNKLLVCQLITN